MDEAFGDGWTEKNSDEVRIMNKTSKRDLIIEYFELHQRYNKLVSELAQLRAESELDVEAYLLHDGDYAAKVILERAKQIDNSVKWAIRRGGRCLSKSGKWDYEPSPSARDDEYLKSHRFDSVDEAVKVWRNLPAAAEVK